MTSLIFKAIIYYLISSGKAQEIITKLVSYLAANFGGNTEVDPE